MSSVPPPNPGAASTFQTPQHNFASQAARGPWATPKAPALPPNARAKRSILLRLFLVAAKPQIVSIGAPLPELESACLLRTPHTPRRPPEKSSPTRFCPPQFHARSATKHARGPLVATA